MIIQILIGIIVSMIAKKSLYAPPLPDPLCVLQNNALTPLCTQPPGVQVTFQSTSKYEYKTFLFVIYTILVIVLFVIH